ncbi:DUF1842 domain-containing protein [Pseudomonas sp. MWU13-2105]|uniref:DUF1842 domain-containing protein n=1 Tax=Pseudomonas sp. MWU13-2105 TaxID=2935074 RepID=UPI00200BCB62|nr:DUF1842 domain-containing protein [Pseudomonas sp. MWU13-2105]
MSDSTQQFVGLFPLSYRIGTSAPGAQSLVLNLLVFTPEQSVSGTAVVTQAINPPLDLQSDVWGEYTYMTVMSPAVSKILITAQGNHGGPSSNSAVNFKLHLVVGSDWKDGVASYQYLDGQRWVNVQNVPAHLEQPVQSNFFPAMGPGPVILPYPHIMPLYAAPIQSAIASGDLAQMKHLAGLAKQQLEQQPQLQSALEAARSEISRLERR